MNPMQRFLCLALVSVVAAVLGVRPASAANPVVEIKTSMGTIKVELFEDKAPTTVKNFLQYTEDKFFDGTVFHRVIPDFMIQGGGFEKGFSAAKTPAEAQAKQKKTRDPIQNESNNGVSNTRGTLAMARTNDPNSATAQFFINLKDNTFLDKAEARDKVGYCVFGKVIEGMDVVDKIKGVKTTTVARFENVPAGDVVIESVRVVKK
jgi:cyclophilin family peptidyl-prolyl cis-trans isomerase